MTSHKEQSETSSIKIGVSSCLLGNRVRYNESDVRNPFITDTFGQYVTFVPVCPEVECGLETPRPAMHLQGDIVNPRLWVTRTGEDFTDQVANWAQGRIEDLAAKELCGFIFKKNSPSCGWDRVKVFNDKGQMVKKGSGIFAGMFVRRFPLIPVEEEGRLNDPKLRDNFIERVFALRRWRNSLSKGRTRANLVEFHTHNKMVLRSHSEKHYRLMGKLVAAGKKRSTRNLYGEYEELMMIALALHATVAKHTNIMMHILGYFKKQLSAADKEELLGLIDEYRRGNLPLVVPLTLFSHYARKYDQVYLKQQTYLNPHLVALQLRNHA